MTGLAAFLAALGLSYVGTRLLLRVRPEKAFLDIPNERSSHDTPKPRFGGIAIAGAFFVVFSTLLVIRPELRSLLPLMAGAGLVFVVGIIDDWRGSPIWMRFLVQIAAAVIVVASGGVVREITLPMIDPINLGAAAVPFTILFILTCINFYNFIDGIDGLAAGNATIAAGFMAFIAIGLGHTGLALACLVVAGAAAGFLQFNFPPSRLFMGDSGSTFLGFFFAYVAVTGATLTPKIPLFIPALMLSALFVDAGVTLVKRAIRGEKVLQAHKTHYFQRLINVGFTHKQVTVLYYGLSLLLGTSAVIYFNAGGFFLAFIAMVWVGVFSGLMLKIRGLERGGRMFWERRTFWVIASDLALIAIAYFAAFFLRTGFRMVEPHWTAVLTAFPIVVVVRSACFHFYGLYRGMWKYTSTPDIVRIIKAVTAGTALMVILMVLAYRFVDIPRSLVVIEYFLLILALTGSRFANRLFHEFGREAVGASVRRVAIIGAGDYGERLGREIRNTEGRMAQVVCYIDDDKEKSGLILQGVPILGPITDLRQICDSYKVDELVIGIRKLAEDKVRAIVSLAREADVPIERGAESSSTGEPDYVLFDRLTRDLDRVLPVRVNEATSSFFKQKRTLVTNGGGALGPMLVSELVALGAKVTVQIDSAFEMQRFSHCGKDVDVVITTFDREVDAERALAAADPQVVIHAVPLTAPSSMNEREYLWRRTVRSARALRQQLGAYPVESIVVCEMWDDVPLDGYAAALGAAVETTVLGAAELATFGPKVVRLPSVLTQREVSRAIAMNGLASTSAARYAMHQLEAITLVLNAAASYKGRALLVPRTERCLTLSDVQAASQRRGAAPQERRPSREAIDPGPLFPTESLKPSILNGAKEVITPLFPASDVLAGYVAQCLHEYDESRLDHSLRLLRSVLFERTADLPADESTA